MICMSYTFKGLSIVQKISKGGEGVVYKCLDNVEKRIYAVKVFNKQVKDERLNSIINLQKDSETFCAIKYVSQIEKCGKSMPYIVLEYCFCSLSVAVKSARILDIDILLYIVKSILKCCLELMDKGIVHNDIKPDNFLVNDKGKILLTDFTTCSKEGDDDPRSATEYYRSPDRRNKNIKSSFKTDWYSAGISILEILTGDRLKLPSSAEPEDFAQFIKTSLSEHAFKDAERVNNFVSKYDKYMDLFERSNGDRFSKFVRNGRNLGLRLDKSKHEDNLVCIFTTIILCLIYGPLEENVPGELLKCELFNVIRPDIKKMVNVLSEADVLFDESYMKLSDGYPTTITSPEL